ncbi:MAG: hypothetical protein ACYS9X_10000 [Planctomycetota bacterium]|jgi:hypothetical protein
MKTNLFWQGLSCVALVAALAVVVVHVTSERPAKAGGGAAGGIIAVTAAESGLHRLYLVDTNRKVVLVYGGRNQYEFSMLSGRYFDIDAQATVGSEWQFRQQGYTITQMQMYLKKKAASSRDR